MSYLGSDTGRNHKNLDCLTEIYKVYDLNKKQISELTNRLLMLNQSLSHAGSVPDPTGTFIKNCQNQIASCKYQISILQEANNQLVKKYPAVQFIGKGKSKTEEIRKGFEKVENAQDNLFKDIMEDKVPLHQIDIIRDKALERIESEYKDDKEKIEQVKKYIEKAEKVDFYLNIGKTVLSLALVAACFFAPAGSALAIGIATGSAVTDISASIWDFHDARISNELAYSSAIGNEFSSTSMASADFQYGMAIFNMVLSAVSISEIKNATKAYKSFNELSEEARDLIGKVSPSTGKRLLNELEEGELAKFLTIPENQFKKITNLEINQLKEISKLTDSDIKQIALKCEKLTEDSLSTIRGIASDLIVDIKNLEPIDINEVVKLSGNNSKLIEDVFKERKAIISGKNLDQLIEYFNIPYTPKDKSLTMYQTRIWYKWRESKIDDLIEKGKTLEEKARIAFNERNAVRTKARDSMLNRAWAERLMLVEKNHSWDVFIKGKLLKYEKRNLSVNMDDIYREIIESSKRSRPGVDHMFGL